MRYTKVTVGREWAKRELFITVETNVKGISSTMTLEEFLTALVEEAGNPALLMTKAQLLQRLSEGADSVLGKMKQETLQLFS